MGAIAGFVLVMKVFDWLRINDSTAFYILLIEKTMEDISAFMVLLFVTISMFSMPQTILKAIEISDPDPWDEDSDKIWGSEVLNQFLDQY